MQRRTLEREKGLENKAGKLRKHSKVPFGLKKKKIKKKKERESHLSLVCVGRTQESWDTPPFKIERSWPLIRLGTFGLIMIGCQDLGLEFLVLGPT